MTQMLWLPELICAVVAIGGLLFAKDPEFAARTFLAGWQRKQLEKRMDENRMDTLEGLSWTGWVIFVFGTIACIGTLIADAMHR